MRLEKSFKRGKFKRFSPLAQDTITWVYNLCCSPWTPTFATLLLLGIPKIASFNWGTKLGGTQPSQRPEHLRPTPPPQPHTKPPGIPPSILGICYRDITSYRRRKELRSGWGNDRSYGHTGTEPVYGVFLHMNEEGCFGRICFLKVACRFLTNGSCISVKREECEGNGEGGGDMWRIGLFRNKVSNAGVCI